MKRSDLNGRVVVLVIAIAVAMMSTPSMFGADISRSDISTGSTEPRTKQLNDLFERPFIDKFDPILWKKPRSPKLMMLRNLMQTHSIIGMAREQVHELLGMPDTGWPADLKLLSNAEAYRISSGRCGSVSKKFFNIAYIDGRVDRVGIREVDTELDPPPGYSSDWITINLKR